MLLGTSDIAGATDETVSYSNEIMIQNVDAGIIGTPQNLLY